MSVAGLLSALLLEHGAGASGCTYVASYPWARDKSMAQSVDGTAMFLHIATACADGTLLALDAAAHMPGIGSSALMHDSTSTAKRGVYPDERQNPPANLLPSEILRSGEHYASNRGHHAKASCSNDNFKIAHISSKPLAGDAPPEHATVVIEIVDASLARGAVVRLLIPLPPHQTPHAVRAMVYVVVVDLDPSGFKRPSR
jgi:hypothetical protein